MNAYNRIFTAQKPIISMLHLQADGHMGKTDRARQEIVPFSNPHELRHTRATLWNAQGMALYLAARLLGHSDLKMLTKIYDHTSPEPLRQALLEARNQGAPPGGAPTL